MMVFVVSSLDLHVIVYSVGESMLYLNVHVYLLGNRFLATFARTTGTYFVGLPSILMLALR